MDASGRQRVDVERAAPVRSRPLRASRYYKLVLPGGRLHYAGWDKGRYGPGGIARLLLRGQRLGVGPLEAVVERTAGSGVWEEVARIEVAPAPDGLEASGTHAFAPPPPPLEASGHLTAASFSSARLERGREVLLQARADGLEGASLQLVVEREASPGVWVPVDALDAKVAGGGCAVPWRPAPSAAAPVEIESCAFEGAGPSRTLAALVARAPGLEGSQLTFELEREVGPGLFVRCGQAVATVRQGAARARVQLEARGHG